MFSICYNINVALNHQNINNHPEEIYNVIISIDQYEWNEIEFPSHKKVGRSLNQITKQSLLMYYLFPIMLNK